MGTKVSKPADRCVICWCDSGYSDTYIGRGVDVHTAYTDYNDKGGDEPADDLLYAEIGKFLNVETRIVETTSIQVKEI